MAIDDWMKLAMADDSVVADLLVKIKHSEGKSLLTLPTPVLPSWGARKRRSKLEAASNAAILAASAANSARKKDDVLDETEEDSTRCSPTTPLSWNGSGASPSSAADGCDDSRSPTDNTTTRSKATATSEYTSNSASTKKCRRRKTFSQLQEEESSLLQEKLYLTKEIANVSASCKAQRARNESLKRMKLDLGSAPDGLPHPNPDQPKWMAITSSATQGDTLPQPQTAESARSVFLVPDLNMMPSEDDSYMDIQRGMS